MQGKIQLQIVLLQLELIPQVIQKEKILAISSVSTTIKRDTLLVTTPSFQKTSQKLDAVSATSTSVTASLEANILQYIPCIHYLVQFQRVQTGKVRALIYSSSKINAMIPAFAAR